MNGILLLLGLFAVSTAFPASTDSGAVAPVPPRIQALLAGKPSKESLPILTGFINTAGFARLPRTERLHVLDAACESALASGDVSTAARFARQSTPLRAQALMAEPRKKNAGGYASNRVWLTAIPRSLRTRINNSARKAADAGRWSQAGKLYMGCLMLFPDAPDARATARNAAQCFLKTNSSDCVPATVCLLRALNTGLDRCFVREARLPLNREMLEAVATPPRYGFVKDCLEMLGKAFAEASASRKRRVPLGWIVAWRDAMLVTYRPSEKCNRNIWTAVAETAPSVFFARAARLCGAREFLRRGAPYAALKLLNAPLPKRLAERRKHPGFFSRLLGLFRARRKSRSPEIERILEAHRMFLRGMARRELEQYAAAAACFHSAEAGPDPLAADAARLEHARTLELAGDWAGAAALYRVIARHSASVSRRERAQCALRRIAALRKASGSNGLPRRMTPLPEDRSSHGDWFYAYGRIGYVLCAQHYNHDRTSGYFKKHRVRFSTTDPAEPHGRLWVSKEAGGEDPAALWDPVRRKHFPSNRDDRGQQYPLGTGPDLIATLDVPRGNFVLSFYFVNDHNFYEDNRRYTLEIDDARGRLLALADVRDFGGGVYERFAVRGPLRLRCRIRRDMSLNALLSGIFLDPFVPLRPIPGVVLARTLPRKAGGKPGPTRLDALIQAYVRRRQLFVLGGASFGPDAVADVVRLAAESMELARSARVARQWERAASAHWIACECYSFLGRTRCAENVFDDFLDNFARALPPRNIPAEFRRLARDAVLAPAICPRPLRFRVGDCPNGRHRLSRLWRIAFRRVEKAAGQMRGDPAALKALAHGVSVLAVDDFPEKTAEAEELAARFLEKHPAWPLPAAEAWLIAARLWGEQDQPERTVKDMRRAIAVAGSRARPVYWFELVQGLYRAQHPVSEVRAAFLKLVTHTRSRDKHYLRTAGADLLAGACMREKRFDEALKWLTKYAGGDSMAQYLISECTRRRRPTAKHSDAKDAGPEKKGGRPK